MGHLGDARLLVDGAGAVPDGHSVAINSLCNVGGSRRQRDAAGEGERATGSLDKSIGDAGGGRRLLLRSRSTVTSVSERALELHHIAN